MHIEKQKNLSSNKYFDNTETLSEKFLHISPYTILENIPEMLSEWWANTKKDMKTFLQDEGLSKILDEKVFTDVLLGKYYFSGCFLLLIKEKLPYNVTLGKLYAHNKIFANKHPNAKELKVNEDLLIQLLKEIYTQKEEKKKQKIRARKIANRSSAAQASARYRLSHKQEVKESKRRYRQTHQEQIKAYKESRREITNEQSRKRYRANLEQNREKNRIYGKKAYREKREKILERQAKYRAEHQEQIKQRRAERMENEEYRLKVRAQGRESYKRNSAEILKRRTQKRQENLEEVRAQEKIYGKTYREKHRKEINERNRASYQKNLSENRKRGAERQAKYRIRKRLKTQTGETIMSLLAALIAKKNQEK